MVKAARGSSFSPDPWRIRQAGFDPAVNRFMESVFSLGNEHMGVRGFFEEGYSGDSLPGTYMAGIYYPDRTRVGWWKNGYPEYFAKVVNSTNWLGLGVELDGERLDLAVAGFRDFRRELDMCRAVLTRSFVWQARDGRETELTFTRFLSMDDPESACISVTAAPLNYEGRIAFLPVLDGGVANEDANYGETFWDEVERRLDERAALLIMKTKKTGFYLGTAMAVRVRQAHGQEAFEQELIDRGSVVGWRVEAQAGPGCPATLEKFVAVCTSLDHEQDSLAGKAVHKAKTSAESGFEALLDRHARVMAAKWEKYDIALEGDIPAQQGVRFNILQLVMTYLGGDPRLNIGPKGLTGEKYGGGTYWDTEAICFPFYLYTDQRAARNLLYYRCRHLEKAKENAALLGLPGALYPMVTMDGRECHNEWEITFEEIHRNAAVAYAICSYTGYTGDRSYLLGDGLEVLVEISRFWAGRVSYNERKHCYMLLGVTGPNEYENNVNNNWYTNYMAAWTLEYTLDALNLLEREDPDAYQRSILGLGLRAEELKLWREIAGGMFCPYDEELGIFEQQDCYLDKEQSVAADIPPDELPLNQHWSWDRILRSPFIKQADVVLGFYFLPERFCPECQRRNFDYYEARTVHESSLSPSVHSIVASRIGYRERAYRLFLRSARLDLDDRNGDTADGLHLTSMGGTWAAVVQGFAGASARDSRLSLAPYLPSRWRAYCFRIAFRGRQIRVVVEHGGVAVAQIDGEPMEILVYGRLYHLGKDRPVMAPYDSGGEDDGLDPGSNAAENFRAVRRGSG